MEWTIRQACLPEIMGLWNGLREVFGSGLSLDRYRSEGEYGSVPDSGRGTRILVVESRTKEATEPDEWSADQGIDEDNLNGRS